MGKIVKEDIKNLLLKETNFSYYNEKNLNNLLDEIYDINKEEVYPLNKVETFVLRKRLGVLDNGKAISKVEIASIIGLTHTSVNNIFNKALFKIVEYIKYDVRKNVNNKMTSIDLLENKSEFENILILSLDIDTRVINRLNKNNIYTIKDLMSYSLLELKKIAGDVSTNSLKEYFKTYGICFLDNLDMSKKYEIFRNSDRNVIENSSPYWLFDVERVDKSILLYIDAKNIFEYFKKLEITPLNIRVKILNHMLPFKYMVMEKINDDMKKNK